MRRPPHHRQQVGPRRLDFGVAGLDGARDDHHLGRAQVSGIVAHDHRDAQPPQALDAAAFGHVAALNLVAQIVHDLGDAAHADAADADEMDGANIKWQALHAAALSLSSPLPPSAPIN